LTFIIDKNKVETSDHSKKRGETTRPDKWRNFKIIIMKSKLTVFLATLFLSVCTLSGNAQTSIPKGKAQLIEFTNETAQFRVPEGKSWFIYSIFSDYVVDGVVKFNEYTKTNEYTDDLDIRIFLKDLNGTEKTNYIKNIYGTQLYRSSNASTVIPFPVIFPEKTTFNLIVLKGGLGTLKLHNGKAYISIMEVDN